MLGRTALLLVALTGCRGVFGIEEGVPLTVDGGGTDALPQDAGLTCFNVGLLLCVDVPPEPPLIVSDVLEIDTDVDCTAVVPRTVGVPLCVLLHEAITVPTFTQLDASGGRPLVLAATGDIVVDGVIDAGSTFDEPGPGANAPACAHASTPVSNMVNNTGSGGGAGGSFGARGGRGGNGNVLNVPAAGGQSGLAVLAPLGEVRGGCPGQAGASAAGQSMGGDGGHGGGAVWLVSGSMIAVSGRVLATGNGGRGAGINSGGGGGGSGGLIGLGAPTVTVSGVLSANGGGGGGGGGDNAGGLMGVNGTQSGVPAAGGQSAGGDSGDGGNGGSLASPVGANGQSDTDGAGGGGGGVGIIEIYAPAQMLPGLISPAPIMR